MKSCLILDTETTGVDPEFSDVVEIGAVLWSVEHRSIIECYSCILHAGENPAEETNGIPAGLLKACPGGSSPIRRIDDMAEAADAIVVHNAEFDRGFLDSDIDVARRTWICTIEDLVWPKPSAGRSLTALALAHGVAVVSAHRAIHDCLLLARCFEAIPDIGERLEAALAHAQLPKAEIHSLAPFEQKDLKEHGFHWDAGRKVWHRFMAIADAEKLPFKTRVAR